ncbi:MAG: hypothetical protein HOM52_07150 [Rhodospirillaceae bacterium]|nr:hypothetical protein [Rhodospirillaceae bacterium]MBT3926092.1 hypothetical protein [Rhodospirillaceae bacterium]MBT4428432.1 hypothetical protein [Rhodospirillaceae bacterium]MBT5038271.1 hypothetical protein [Rhodospirillaceae bacterium]MBT5677009.1 hypothetical protein [Rhodospirillaceae bacterium]
MAFDNLEMMSVRDRAGLNHQQKLFNLSGGPKDPSSGQEFAQVIAEAAGLDGNQAIATRQGEAFFGDDGFGFDDFVDLINPLQHIPIVSSIYRDLTGDTISDGARIFGGAIFGGPIGFASAIGNVAVKEVAGKDVGELALSVFDSDTPEGEILTAGISPAPLPSVTDVKNLSNIAPAAGPVADIISETESAARDNAAALSAFAADLAKPTAQRSVPDYLDRMSEADKALLLSSIGLASDTAAKSVPEKAAQKLAPREVAPKQVQELFVRSAATPDSPPINSAVMEWPDAKVPPGIDPNSPDWIAKSMSRALDKYEQTFDATRKKSDQIDSKI